MIYGYENTFHKVGHLDIEIDRHGKVVSVWYRCMTLPFEVHKVDDERAATMRTAYTDRPPQQILAMDIEDRPGNDERAAYLTEDTVEQLREQLSGCRKILEKIEAQLESGTMV